MDWLFVGSSANAKKHLSKAPPVDQTITSNHGLRLLRPDWYFCVRQNNNPSESEMQSAWRAGTTMVTLHRQGFEWFDITIRDSSQKVPRKGGFGRFRASGPFCLQIACMFGARRIYMAGCCGYGHHNLYFDMHDREDFDRRNIISATKNILQPEIQAIVSAWDHVEFIPLGPTLYRISGENWRTDKQA